MAGKSSKDCTLDGIQNDAGEDLQPGDEAGWKIVTCPKVEAHWYRNYATGDVEEDIQLDEDLDVPQIHSIRGYIREHASMDFSSPGNYIWGEEGLTITPVSTAYLCNRDETYCADNDESGETNGENGG